MRRAPGAGYCSDCTRTFATGLLPQELREAYAACLDGQVVGLEAVRAGITGVDADAVARDSIEAAGFGERFGHGLGHNIELKCAEAPRPRRKSPTLKAPIVTTVEPGIYLPELGGIRIEDLVIVTDSEPEILTDLRREGPGRRCLNFPAVARDRQHQPIQERHAHRGRRTVFAIVEFQHVKPGKGGAFVRSKLEAGRRGAVIDKTFRAGEKFPPVG